MQKIIIGFLLTLLLVSCSISYSLEGGKIDYNLTKTIAIQNFPIRAAFVYPPLEQAFNSKLRTRYIEQTRLKEVSSNPDIAIEGEITGYDVTGVAVKEDAYTSETRLTITVTVRYTNNKRPADNLEQSFSAFRQYPSSEPLDAVQDGLVNQITTELVDMIFNATAGSW